MGYTAGSTSLVSLTGVASRSVGWCIGVIFVGLAFLPKLIALLLMIPAPVAGIYLMVLMAVLFLTGARTVLQDGFDLRTATIAGLAFWVGVGAQSQAIFADRLHGAWGVLLGNGMTVGALTAILLTLVLELTNPRRSRLELQLDSSALPGIDGFLHEIAARLKWDDAHTERLRAAGEEVLSVLLGLRNDGPSAAPPRLLLRVRPNREAVEMEYIAVFDEESIEDRLANLSEQPEIPDADEVSLRLLRHYASSVRHQKYHGLDIVTVCVGGTAR